MTHVHEIIYCHSNTSVDTERADSFTCHMTHVHRKWRILSHVYHNSCIRIHILSQQHITDKERADSFICDMPHLHVTRRIHMRDNSSIRIYTYCRNNKIAADSCKFDMTHVHVIWCIYTRYNACLPIHILSQQQDCWQRSHCGPHATTETLRKIFQQRWEDVKPRNKKTETL